MNQVLEILRRRRKLFIVPVIIVFVIPLLFSWMFMRSYEADALVWLEKDINLSSVLEQPNAAAEEDKRPIRTEAETLEQLLESRKFVREVIQQTPLRARMTTPERREETIEYVRKNLYMEQVGPNAMRIGFFGRSPGEAVTVSKVTTNHFVATVRKAAAEQNKKSSGFFGGKVDLYAAELDKARAAMQQYKEDHPETQQLEIRDKVLNVPDVNVAPAVQLEFQRLQAQVDSAQEMHASAVRDLARIRLVGSAQEERFLNGMSVVDQPASPTGFSLKRLALFDALALVAALVVGAIAVAVAEIGDRTLRTEQDVADHLELPVLAVVPQNS